MKKHFAREYKKNERKKSPESGDAARVGYGEEKRGRDLSFGYINKAARLVAVRKFTQIYARRAQITIFRHRLSLKGKMHWKGKTLQSLPSSPSRSFFLSHNRSRKWVSFPAFICAAFPGETLATPPYLCRRRVPRWIMKWIMQMHHNIFILAEVEVRAPVPGIYEYANKTEK